MTLSSSKKLTNHGLKNSNYTELEMSDKSVFDLAACGVTIVEIAALFRVNKQTIMNHHHDAFTAGKASMKMVPRVSLRQNLQKLMDLVDKMLERVGEEEITVDKNGEPTSKERKIDTHLYQAYLDTVEACSKYIPKDVEEAPVAAMTAEELKARINVLMGALK